MNRLRSLYDTDITDAMMKKFNYKNKLAVPKIEKVVVNMGLGEAKENAKVIENATRDMNIITGQKPIVTKAKKSVSAFKLRTGMPIGCKVTLRGDRMYSFIDRLINVSIPRVRDFRGVSPDSFDGRGNYTLGIKEQLIFPEIQFDKIDKVRGMEVVFVTTAETDEEARELLSLFGMPFIRANQMN
jgi:large subunit ribosomal protein L5